MKTTFVAVCAAALLLAGCQGNSEPSAPPTSQDALTTTDAAPSTASPPDDVSETSSAPAGDAETATEASGPPKMPDEAKEDSESGAEAFALHYVDLINHTSRHPEVGLLEPLGADGCKSCANHEDSVAYMVEHGETMERDGLEGRDSVSLHAPADSDALVRVRVLQVAQSVFGPDGEATDQIDELETTLVFDVEWAEAAWRVREITVDMGKQ